MLLIFGLLRCHFIYLGFVWGVLSRASWRWSLLVIVLVVFSCLTKFKSLVLALEMLIWLWFPNFYSVIPEEYNNEMVYNSWKYVSRIWPLALLTSLRATRRFRPLTLLSESGAQVLYAMESKMDPVWGASITTVSFQQIKEIVQRHTWVATAETVWLHLILQGNAWLWSCILIQGCFQEPELTMVPCNANLLICLSVSSNNIRISNGDVGLLLLGLASS